MTDDDKRLALMTGSCPDCGHGVLNHRSGRCRVVLSHGPSHPMTVCNCAAIQPPNSQGEQLELRG